MLMAAGQAPAAARSVELRDGQMGQTPQWYDDAYGVALRITPRSAWTIPG
jgi:hypothetical protein